MTDNPSGAMNTVSAPNPDTGGNPDMGGDLAVAIALLAQTLAAQNVHVMVCSPILHIALNPRSRLRWLDPFPTLSDRPPTPLGRRPPSHSLSQTLVCFYHPSLLDILDFP